MQGFEACVVPPAADLALIRRSWTRAVVYGRRVHLYLLHIQDKQVQIDGIDLLICLKMCKPALLSLWWQVPYALR